MWRRAEYVCFSWMGTQGSYPHPSAPFRVHLHLRLSACVCVVLCWGGGRVLQQQTGLISDIKQPHISRRKQTELAAAPHLYLQVHASQSSTSRKHPSHKDIKSRIEVTAWKFGYLRLLTLHLPLSIPSLPTAEHK